MKGDKKYNISTFASKRGVKFTARAACAVLALNYVSAIVQGVLSPGESTSYFFSISLKPVGFNRHVSLKQSYRQSELSTRCG